MLSPERSGGVAAPAAKKRYSRDQRRKNCVHPLPTMDTDFGSSYSKFSLAGRKRTYLDMQEDFLTISTVYGVEQVLYISP